MKRLSIYLLIILTVVSLSPVFASEEVSPIKPDSSAAYSALYKGFTPTSPRRQGMGNAGLAIVSGSDSLFYNPAGLASKRAVVQLPSAGVTVYNPYKILKEGLIDKVKDAIDTDSYTDLIDPIEKLYGTGLSKVADVDAAAGFSAGGFALALNVKDSLHTYNLTSNGGIYDQLNTSLSIGYGARINIASNFSIDLGVAARLNYLAYSDLVDVSDVLNALNDGDLPTTLKKVNLMAGYSFPIDVGININLPLNFKIGVVARNLNGKMYMTSFENYEALMKSPFNGSSKFSFDTDWSLDAGFAWQWKDKFFSPTIAFDVVDTVGLFRNKLDARSLISHINAGAEIRLLSFLDIRGGFNQGYWTLGTGLDIFVIKMDVAYFWQELGKTAGANPVDGLSVKFNIGWDR